MSKILKAVQAIVSINKRQLVQKVRVASVTHVCSALAIKQVQDVQTQPIRLLEMRCSST